MKKFIYITFGILFLLIGIIIVMGINDVKVEVEKHEDVVSAFEEEDTFLLVIGASTCSYCKSFKDGTLTQYLKDPQIPLYFMYTDQSFPNTTELSNFLTEYEIDYNSSPTSYIVSNGQVVASNEGDISLSELKQFIDKNI